VGASKVALALEPEELWQGFSSFGLGQPTGAYFPGEAMGSLPDLQRWGAFDRATLAFGYGLATSTLQLARAYMVLGNGGILRPVSLMKTDNLPEGRRVFSSDTIKHILGMMESVALPGGTAEKAAVENYRVAGKTGTAKKASRGGYSDAKYVSVFAGVIPASKPRLAMVVMIDEPQGSVYYGGLVAAPVFSVVMTSAMRLLNIDPDNLPESRMLVAQQ
jgi:cell division protein FtsI (penicillin-binding protein 3)